MRCACALRDAARELGVELRAGLHTGECDVAGDGVGGVAVEIAACVLAQAGAGEVVVSGTVRDLAAGSGIRFDRRDGRTVKGAWGEWETLAVEDRREQSPVR